MNKKKRYTLFVLGILVGALFTYMAAYAFQNKKNYVTRVFLEDFRLNFMEIFFKDFDPLRDFDESEIRESVELDVPFTAQAPFGDWSVPYDEACEEASLIMAHYYNNGEDFSLNKADEEIKNLYGWESANSYKVDVNIGELKEIALNYYKRGAKTYYDEDVSIDNIKYLLSKDYPVIIPAAGQTLGNPNFRGAGPPYHMLVLTGYKDAYFYSNDPGTRNGHKYVYSYEVIMNAIHDWQGSKTNIREGRKAMMVLEHLKES